MMRLLILAVMLSVLFLAGCATSSSVNIAPGARQEIRSAQSVIVSELKCNDPSIAAAVRNVIMEGLLTSGRRLLRKGDADLIVEGTITLSTDSVGGSFGSFSAGQGSAFGAGGSVNSSGGYVSGITIHILKGEEILAAATVTQVRTDMWIPDPPEVMARKIATKIRSMMY